jgi:hypothetical protein
VPEIERFVIAGQPSVLRPLLDILAADPEVSVISVASPQADPERLVVAMNSARAQALSQALGSRLIVEPDEDVYPTT